MREIFLYGVSQVLKRSGAGAVHMQLKKTEPEPCICPLCGDKVGISLQSLAVHVRTKHHEAYADYEGMLPLPESPK